MRSLIDEINLRQLVRYLFFRRRVTKQAVLKIIDEEFEHCVKTRGKNEFAY